MTTRTTSATVAGALLVSSVAHATTYELERAAGMSQGCYEPCDCLLEHIDEIEGNFELTPQSLTGTYDVWSVSGLSWTVGVGDDAIEVTGAGTYERFSEFAVQHRLQLDLVVDGDAPQHFDSGWLVTTTSWPAIDITISMNQMVCFDRVFFVVAAPAGPGTPHPADVDEDGAIDVDDMIQVIQQWGPCPPTPGACPADVDEDGAVGVDDLVQVIVNWHP